MKSPAYQYKLPPVEKAINQLVQLVFYYRLVLVLGSLAGIVYAGNYVFQVSNPGERLKNATLVVTGGSVIIGIFYSMLNYEHSQLKFRHDIKVSRETLTFTTTCKMYEQEFIRHFKLLKAFYETHRQLFVKAAFAEIQQRLKEDDEARMAFVVLFNYFEGISLGIQQGIMDEGFMKEFFKTIFIEYHHLFEGLLLHLRKERKSERLFWRFSQLAAKWRQEV